MGSMEQGEAAVWAAGLGIIGTLLGALGGAWFQGLSARRQLREQAAAQVKHQLRDERRAAFADVLDRCDQVAEALGPIIVDRVPSRVEEDSYRELWASANAALRALQRAVTAVPLLVVTEWRSWRARSMTRSSRKRTPCVSLTCSSMSAPKNSLRQALS
jgi:hypothetical protein